MNKAQRKKISLKNLAKARKAKSVKGARKSVRKAAPAKKRSVRKAGKRTIAIRNLAHARSARKRNKAKGGPKHRVSGYAYKRPAKTVRVKSHMSYEAAEAPKKRRSGRKGKRRHLSMKKSAVAARKRRRMGASEAPRSRKRRSSGRKHVVKAHYTKRKGKRVHVKRHLSAETPKRRRGKRRSHSRALSRRRGHSMSRRRGYALENPLSKSEIAVGAVTGVVGFIAADALDRVLATHALGAGSGTSTDGKPLFGDTPPTTGAYAGLYNATAVLAPMDWKRWLAGAGITAVPFVIAAYIKNPMGRSSLQFFGFGAGVRILGKAATDLLAMLLGRTSYGARLYDGEARAAAHKALAAGKPDTTGDFPQAGLGALPEAGFGSSCGCVNCVTGVGACCRFNTSGTPAPSPSPAPAPQPTPQPAPPPAPPQQVSPPALPPVQMPTTPFTPSIPVAQPQPRVAVPGGSHPVQRAGGGFRTPLPGGHAPTAFAGLPDEAPRRSRYNWGSDQEQQSN